MICGQGTTYDPASGTCLPDIEACADGTVLVDGACVPDDDTLTADADEAAEPNASKAGDIVIPAIDAPAYVVHGCIEPVGGEADLDPWLFTVDGPTYLEVTADGVGGLAAGFQVVSDDEELAADGWVRFGLNLVGDTSVRKLYLPKAGTYALAMTDSRTLVFEGGFGGAGACYYTSVKRLAVPEPVALPAPTVEDELGDEPRFYTVTPADVGVVAATLFLSSPNAVEQLVALDGEGYRELAGEGVDGLGRPVPAQVAFGGLTGEPVILVVDTVFSTALAPVGFVLSVANVAPVELPENGTVTIEQAGAGGRAFFYFDVEAPGDILRVDLGFDRSTSFRVVDLELDPVVSKVNPGGAEVTTIKEWIRFAEAGRYYIELSNAAAGGDIEVTSKSGFAPITPLSVGTPIVDHPFSPLGASFFALDPGDTEWLALSAGATNFGGAVRLGLIPTTTFGFLGSTSFRFSATFNALGTDVIGRIVAGLDEDYLVMALDVGTTGASPLLDVSISERDAQTLELPAGGTLGLEDEALVATVPRRFLVHGQPGDEVTIAVTPDAVDVTLRVLTPVETNAAIANAGGAGVVEQLVRVVPPEGWLAFSVTSAVAGNFDLALSARSPRPYTVSAGTLAFVSVCPAQGGAGALLPQTATTLDQPVGDESITAAQTLPFAFSFFDDAVTTFKVTSNGQLLWNPALTSSFNTNLAIPSSAAPQGGFVAAYWDDLEKVSICRLDAGEQVIVEWRGDVWSSPENVEVQAVLHADGVIDLVYGPGHTASGTSGTVGLENLLGGFGQQVVFNTFGVILPGTSQTFTPAGT
jgi:hypothetical protein